MSFPTTTTTKMNEGETTTTTTTGISGHYSIRRTHCKYNHDQHQHLHIAALRVFCDFLRQEFGPP
eukprot:scaffold735_cov116-Cylindrotheca_fusiformis.AAC.28